MKHLFTFILFALIGLSAYGQNTVKGYAVDGETGEPLIGANVIIEGESIGTIVGLDGSFVLKNVPTGEQTLTISYLGYNTYTSAVSVTTDVNLGDIGIISSEVGLNEVQIVASVAVDRKTPVAVSTIKAQEIKQLVGNQEFPEIMKSTPSVYVTKSGGGFGDARINVRGFDQSNTAVLINGIPVNDMENGWVYWSNWAGLADVASTVQVQRGLGATKLAVPSAGGSINIITNPAEREAGGQVSIATGNDAYQKYGLSLSSGLLDNGWAFTMQATHTKGNGYVDGTQFSAFSYFGSISKTFNKKHTIVLSGLGAPQWHHQRLVGRFDGVTLRTFDDPDNTDERWAGSGIRFNSLWGTLNGEEFSWRRNFYHKPKFFVNHYWNIGEKTNLKTSAYASYGRGGGTGPRGRINHNGSSLFDNSSAFRDDNGQVRWDDMVAWNQGAEVDTSWGVKTQDTTFNYSTSGDNGFIRRASMNSHNWYGILSTLTHSFNKNLILTAGIDGRYYKGIHYRRVENLLGNDAYLSTANDNNPNNFIMEESPAEFGSFIDNSYQDGTNVLNYWNDGLVSWAGLFAQLEYSKNGLSAFATINGSNQGFKRVDYFNYLDSDPEQETDWQNFLGGLVKAGANYNFNKFHNVYVNGGLISRQPIFDNVFINFRNDINPDVANQSITALEMGYGFRSSVFSANVNLYNTLWGNRQFNQTIENELEEEILYIFDDVSQLHRGVELEATVNPVKQLSFDVMLSLGDWAYADNFSATGTNIDTNTPVDEELTIFAKDLEVGDAAQTTFRIAANYKPVKGLKIFASYYFADRLFAQYDVDDSQFLNEGGSIVQLPSYDLVDAGLFYSFNLAKTNLDLGINVNNVLDKIYIAELDTNIEDDPTTTNRNEFYDNRGFFGFGRTWNASLRIKF